MDCLVELNFHISLTAVEKKNQNKPDPPKSLMLLGVIFCVFYESTNKGYKSSLIFQKEEELKPECETPWCCGMLPK